MVLKGILMLAVGVYAGIYIDQNYQFIPEDCINENALAQSRLAFAGAKLLGSVPRVDDPQGLWQKLSEYLEQYKKDFPKKPSDKS